MGGVFLFLSSFSFQCHSSVYFVMEAHALPIRLEKIHFLRQQLLETSFHSIGNNDDKTWREKGIAKAYSYKTCSDKNYIKSSTSLHSIKSDTLERSEQNAKKKKKKRLGRS